MGAHGIAYCAADRLAIRELGEVHAHCPDLRDAKKLMSLFTADSHFVVYMNAEDPTRLKRFILARRSDRCSLS